MQENFLQIQEISCTCRKKQQNVQSLIMLKINVSYLNENMCVDYFILCEFHILESR